MADDRVLSLLDEAVAAVQQALAGFEGWTELGGRHGQYRCDLVADEAAVEVLRRGGVGVLSEESGRHEGGDVVVVVDPVDGSTNASRGVPWFATSLCALDDEGPVAALVVNLATGTRFEAVRDGGARRDGVPMAPTRCTELADAVVGLSGHVGQHWGWQQYRALGAVALDLCAVASGMLDGYVDCSADAHGPWDYLGGLLVCRQAGASVVDAEGRELVVRGHGDRRTPVAAATPELLAALVAARAGNRVDGRRPS